MHVGPEIAQICDFVYKSNAVIHITLIIFLLLMIEFNLF